MPIETILVFLAADLMLCLIPGPPAAVAVAHALPPAPDGGWRGAAGPMIGIHLGNLLWYSLTALGLIALLQAHDAVFTVVRWLGIIYLIWMGLHMLRDSHQGLVLAQPKAAHFAKGVANGFAVQISNPRALAFYTAFIPQFIDPANPLFLQLAILAALTIFTEQTGLTVYTAIAVRLRERGGGQGAGMKRIAGIVMVLAALFLAYNNSSFASSGP
jgi:homoserine/homoserine lactone efflux protein